MLVGGKDHHALIFGGLYQAGLAFQVEVLLAADKLLIFHHQRGVLQRLLPVTALLNMGGAHELFPLGGGDRIKAGRLLIDLYDGGLNGLAGET